MCTHCIEKIFNIDWVLEPEGKYEVFPFYFAGQKLSFYGSYVIIYYYRGKRLIFGNGPFNTPLFFLQPHTAKKFMQRS